MSTATSLVLLAILTQNLSQVTVKRHGFILLSHLKVLSLLDLVFNINWQIRAIVALEAREEHVQRGCIKLDGATFWDYI